MVNLSPFVPERSLTRKEDLKKNLKNVDLETELLGFLDTSAAQNLPNTVKTLYTPGSNNTIAKNDEKFKINATGWQGVNYPSIIQFTTNTKAHEFAKYSYKYTINQ
ncbi:MAG: Pseudogene of transposase [Methanobrevibacter sp. CfCl-M3]